MKCVFRKCISLLVALSVLSCCVCGVTSEAKSVDMGSYLLKVRAGSCRLKAVENKFRKVGYGKLRLMKDKECAGVVGYNGCRQYRVSNVKVFGVSGCDVVLSFTKRGKVYQSVAVVSSKSITDGLDKYKNKKLTKPVFGVGSLYNCVAGKPVKGILQVWISSFSESDCEYVAYNEFMTEKQYAKMTGLG